MEIRTLLMCIALGTAAAQRGHYAGQRPVNGLRYQSDLNFGGFNQNRFSDSSNFYQQPIGYHQPYAYQQRFHPAGFSGFGSGFPINQGYHQIPYGPFGFNGRKR